MEASSLLLIFTMSTWETIVSSQHLPFSSKVSATASFTFGDSIESRGASVSTAGPSPISHPRKNIPEQSAAAAKIGLTKNLPLDIFILNSFYISRADKINLTDLFFKTILPTMGKQIFLETFWMNFLINVQVLCKKSTLFFSLRQSKFSQISKNS